MLHVCILWVLLPSSLVGPFANRATPRYNRQQAQQISFSTLSLALVYHLALVFPLGLSPLELITLIEMVFAMTHGK